MFIFRGYFKENGEVDLPPGVVRDHVKAFLIAGDKRTGYIVTDKDLSNYSNLRALKKNEHFEALVYFAYLHDELFDNSDCGNDTGTHGAAIPTPQGD